MTVKNILTKSDEWHAERRTGIGGSDAITIMNGDWLPLWEEKTGRAPSADLSAILPVQIGLVTEPLNVLWFERAMGKKVCCQGEMRRSLVHPFMRCTLDGLVDDLSSPAIVQCKHVNAFAKIDDVAQKYQPQVHHEMAVCGLDRAFLSVFIGTLTYEAVEIQLDEFYLATLIDREKEFWSYVQADEPPSQRDPVAPPVPPSKWRTVDMSASNSWGEHAGVWLANRDGAKKFDTACKEIKALVAADVGEATGHGVIAKRAKNGAISIKEI